MALSELHDNVQIRRYDVQNAREAMSEFFSPVTLADFLEIPVRTVYGWNHAGTGPRSIKVGKHVRYRRSDVEKWLEAQSQPRSA